MGGTKKHLNSTSGYQGVGLSVKDSYKKAYIFPDSQIIKPGGFFLIYCDKESRGSHTDFRVDSGKGVVKLWDPAGNEIESVNLAKFPAPEVACGVSASGKWEYFVTPTPGKENTSATSSILLPQPSINPAGGVYSAAVKVAITTSEDLPADAKLCVTTDGREPTLNDAVKGLSYTLTISNSTPLRAKFISLSSISPRSHTESYIFHKNGLNLPIISIVTDDYFLYSTEGILYGKENENPNWEQNWRRPINIEYFNTDGSTQLNQLGEFRVHGGKTRSYPIKSLAIYSNKRFGTKNFNASGFWEDKPHVKTVPSFLLRNGGNDYGGAHILDAYAQLSLGHGLPDVDYQSYRPVVVYINGKYNGLMDLRERSNEDFVESNYDGLEDIDMIENYSELKAGEMSILDDLFNACKNIDTPLDNLAQTINLDNYSATVAFAIYNCHADWLNNNSVWWRSLAEGDDQRLRILTKDLDHTFGRYGALPSQNPFIYLRQFETATNSFTKNISNVVTYLMNHPEGKRILAEKISFIAGDFMHPDYAIPRFNDMIKEIAPEMYDTYGVNQGPGAQSFWYENWENMIAEEGTIQQYIKNRPLYIFDIVQNDFEYSDTYELEIKHEGLGVKFCDIPFTMPHFKSRFFKGHDMRLSEIEGKVWVRKETFKDGSSHSFKYPKGEINYTASPDVTRAYFELVLPGDVNTVETGNITVALKNNMIEISGASGNLTARIYDLAGLKLKEESSSNGSLIMESPAKGVLIIEIQDENTISQQKILIK